ncbi:hypothetical protein [Lichenifustis flavocetrariae]|uniref:Uncharacterized protein n=1 Tax=Lichenifustis flavocetrariae TaxID=2949735 RepID=A0AA41ZB45_9HYPH|nr:hypothetical protein [Lichenifustis flavocetrariae]MCW6512642.1 hypothetical protein [Lichenifustis flavocetrariae]
MSNYIVNFYKTVLNDTGHVFESCQGSVETLAVNELEAVAFAKDRFCEAGRLSDWTMHSDRVEVIEAEFPS